MKLMIPRPRGVYLSGPLDYSYSLPSRFRLGLLRRSLILTIGDSNNSEDNKYELNTERQLYMVMDASGPDDEMGIE